MEPAQKRLIKKLTKKIDDISDNVGYFVYDLQEAYTILHILSGEAPAKLVKKAKRKRKK